MTVVDVREIPPRLKHPTIFQAWMALAAGQSMMIVNDHDPRPLYYQFAAEFNGQFQWEYLEEGPDVWRVGITRLTA